MKDELRERERMSSGGFDVEELPLREIEEMVGYDPSAYLAVASAHKLLMKTHRAGIN